MHLIQLMTHIEMKLQPLQQWDVENTHDFKYS